MSDVNDQTQPADMCPECSGAGCEECGMKGTLSGWKEQHEDDLEEEEELEEEEDEEEDEKEENVDVS